MNGRMWTTGLCLVMLAGVAVGQPAAKPIAVVNGIPISQAELDAVLKAADPVPVTLPEAQRRKRQMEALAMLMDNVLMRQFLEKNTPPVPPAEVSKRIGEMETGLREQGKSLAEFCQDTNQTIDQLRANVVDHLRWNAYVAGNVSESAVAKYYAENKDFFDGTTVRASHIVVRLPSTATDTEKVRARETLARLRQQLAADPKVDFGELARQYSQDPQASKGGDLGWIPRKWYDESFARAAFSLQVNQVSDVVQTDFGMHLIKVTDRKPGKPSEYARIKEAVREFCAEDLRQQILGEQRKTAKIEINLH